MLQRSRNWLNEVLWKPKNPLSIDHLRYLHGVLTKNGVVTERNKSLLVETIRSIAEILIWGDQNDSRVFDFFLEKAMFRFFLRILQQRTSRFLPLQLLQTLNILFENIRNETSIYYLLSNNHINLFIVHRYDFSDEEILAYYISFLKTLSLKLNQHTVHFFYNEHLMDFPLYTEAIKFFNHSESMVRIAVRTITLNVYKVGDSATLEYICNKTAVPYFANLVWFIGKHVLELDDCVSNAGHLRRSCLGDLVAEHLDQLHYLNDILSLGIDPLNAVLTDHLQNRLLLPLYAYSLCSEQSTDSSPTISRVMALFLLSQVFLILSHSPLVTSVADFLLNGDMAVTANLEAASSDGTPESSHRHTGSMNSIRAFIPPLEPLADTLAASVVAYVPTVSPERSRRTEHKRRRRSGHVPSQSSQASEYLVVHSTTETEVVEPIAQVKPVGVANSTFFVETSDETTTYGDPLGAVEVEKPQEREKKKSDKVDDVESVESKANAEPEIQIEKANEGGDGDEPVQSESKGVPPDLVRSTIVDSVDVSRQHPTSAYISAVCESLSCKKNDLEALYAVCLLYGICVNKGVERKLLTGAGIAPRMDESEPRYCDHLVDCLISLIEKICQSGSQTRLVTLKMAIMLLRELLPQLDEEEHARGLNDGHLAMLEGAREASTLQLRLFYKGPHDDIFLDMFEDEYESSHGKPLNVEYLMMDDSLLLPPTGTPMTGIGFDRRLPCGEVERARRAMQIFFIMRRLCQSFTGEAEEELPLLSNAEMVDVDDKLDLNNSDLIACTVVTGEKTAKRFLVVSPHQLVLVQPDTTRLGWGVTKFTAYLQDIEITPDPASSSCLHVVAHHPTAHNSRSMTRHKPTLTGKFEFDDHIRCSAARQRIQHGCNEVKFRKMQTIAKMLQLPPPPPPASLNYGYGYASPPLTVIKPIASSPKIERQPIEQRLESGISLLGSSKSDGGEAVPLREMKMTSGGRPRTSSMPLDPNTTATSRFSVETSNDALSPVVPQEETVPLTGDGIQHV